MRRITLLFATLIAIAGFGAPAAAQDDAYPPRSLTVTVSDGTPGPTEPFDVTLEGCLAGEVVEFEFGGETESLECAFASAIVDSVGNSGAATHRFFAPNEGGTHFGTVTFASTGASIGSFQIEVPTARAASLTIDDPLVRELSWTPGVFSLSFVILILVAAAVAIRLRLLPE